MPKLKFADMMAELKLNKGEPVIFATPDGWYKKRRYFINDKIWETYTPVGYQNVYHQGH